jgi:O-antigen ligase
MAARALALPLPARPAGGAGVVTLAATAVAAGALATVNPLYAVALVLGVVLVALVGTTIDALPVFLVLTMFAESAALGPGVRIGRIAGVLALLVLALYVLQRGARGLRLSTLFGLAMLTGVWMCVSALWCVSGSMLVQSFAVIVRTKRQFMLTFGALAVGSLVFGLISFYGYVKQGHTYLAEGVGATGGSSDHNYFAVYQVVALPAVLALTVLEHNRMRRLLWFAALGVIVLSVAASLSRTGLIALVGAVLLTLFLPWRIFFRRRTQKVSYVIALVGAVAAVALAGASPLVKRAQTIFQPSAVAGHAGSGRIDLWNAAWIGYKRHPILGLGAGGFPARSVQLIQQTPRADASAAYALEPMVVHNMYLEVLTELGPVGEAILLGLLFCVGRTLFVAFRRGRRARDRDIETISIALLVSLVAYCISGIFLSIEANKPLWILIGLALALDVMTRRLAPAVAPVTAAGAPAAPLYDRVVRDPAQRERELERREQRLEEQLAVVAAEREKLERRGSLLDLRARRMEGRETEIAVRLAELERRVEASSPPDLVEREAKLRELTEALGRLQEELAEREETLTRRVAAVTSREGALVARTAELGRRAAAAAREPEPAAPAPEPPVAPPPVQPQPVAVAAPVPVPAQAPILPPAPVPGAYNLHDIESAVDARADAERVDEWRYYVLYLREYADVDGNLPRNFDGLVFDVFGELVPMR